MSSSQPVLVVGTGAMACLIAAKLAASGQKVNMLGSWQAGVAALNHFGLRVLDENGAEHAYPVFATSDPQDLLETQYALILVKTYQTCTAADMLKICLADNGLAVSLQNGLGNLAVLSEKLGSQRAAAGVTTFGSTQLQPGFIRPFYGGEIIIGQHPRVDPLAVLLQSAGFTVNVRDEIDSLIWSKLLVNCAVNPLSLLLETTNGELWQNPYSRQMASLLAEETAKVAAALNIQLPYPDPVAQVEKVMHATAPNRTSMFQDFHRGSPESEIDAINGAVVSAAKQVGVPTPYNQAVTLLVKARFAARKIE
jgi:2-dehydropantoate 2-reductase